MEQEQEDGRTTPTIPPPVSDIRRLLLTALPRYIELNEARERGVSGWSAICEVLTGIAFALQESYWRTLTTSTSEAAADRSGIQVDLRELLLPEHRLEPSEDNKLVNEWLVGYHLNTAVVSVAAATNRILAKVVGETAFTSLGREKTCSLLVDVTKVSRHGSRLRDVVGGIERAASLDERFEPTHLHSVCGSRLSAAMCKASDIREVNELARGEAIGVVLKRAWSFVGSFDGSAKARSKDPTFYRFEWNITACALRDVSELWNAAQEHCHPA